MSDYGAHQNRVGEWVLEAPAKINLWLKIHGRRADGYHELSSLMMALELGDQLRGCLSDSADIQLEVVGPQATADIPSDNRNLVWRALEAVRELARESIPGRPPGVRVVLHKRVPSQAGLGGGSSDAASALALGEKLWGVKGSEDWRRNVLVGLGADCSFFHGVGDSSLALCEGVGEAVTPWPGQAPAVWVALLVPEAICPTGQIFGALAQQRAMLGDCPFDSSQPLHGLDLEGLRGGLATDLEAAALCAVPVLGRWRSLLDSEGAQHWLLSGSGCAFFGLYADEGIARAETDRLVQLAAAEGLSLRGDFVTRPRRP